MILKNENFYIKAAASGDEAAFAELVRTYEKAVFNTVRQRVTNREDALDVSQEVFINIWRSLPNWRGECRFSTWVYRVAVNASLDFLRANSQAPTDPLGIITDEDGSERPYEPADTTATSSPEESLERNETAALVRRAIDQLPDEQREIILLRDIDGFTYDEIADLLGIGIGTVKSRLNRARGRVREILSENFAKK